MRTWDCFFGLMQKTTYYGQQQSKAHIQGKSLRHCGSENDGDDKGEASLKEEVDTRAKTHTRSVSDYVRAGELTVVNVRKHEWQLH